MEISESLKFVFNKYKCVLFISVLGVMYYIMSYHYVRALLCLQPYVGRWLKPVTKLIVLGQREVLLYLMQYQLTFCKENEVGPDTNTY